MNGERKVPERISGYYFSGKNLDIRYDKGVNVKDKIPGLVEFLEYEYEQLLESRGSFILDDDLSEDDMKPIPVVLSSECPMDKRYTMSDDRIAKTIVRELQKECSEDEKERIVKHILRYKFFKPRISGMYFPSNNHPLRIDCDDIVPEGPYIKLYYRNTFCHDEEDYKAKLSACLAHEYFHFLQDSYLKIDFSKKYRYKKPVLESLADFFSFAYCLSKAEGNMSSGINPVALKGWAKGLFDAWRYSFGSEWPYAFAYCFSYGENDFPMDFSTLLVDYNNHGCKEKFNRVMKYSKHSINLAYKELTLDGWILQMN